MRHLIPVSQVRNLRADTLGRLAQVVSQIRLISRRFETVLQATDIQDASCDRVQLDSIFRLMLASHNQDFETGTHLLRVSRFSHALALAMSLQPAEAMEIGTAAPMHDVGKIVIPGAVLCKRGPLSPEERRIMETHTTTGADLLNPARSSVMVTARIIALTHHERWDGTGYPAGLQGSDIPLCGRIVMLADQYDALRSERPYKPRLTHERVCEILLRGDGRTMPEHFAPGILEAFLKVEAKFATDYSELTDLEALAAALETPPEPATGAAAVAAPSPDLETPVPQL
ncbi:MAG: HD domain-containing phosphohydrolase [Bryobacteraceae bacterium]|nr:HD domain-containing phosphohydrolase [Bryobacteraceae bacterium]